MRIINFIFLSCIFLLYGIMPIPFMPQIPPPYVYYDNIFTISAGNSAVAISGDGNTIVVGNRFATATVANEGEVYVYLRNGDTWILNQTILNLAPGQSNGVGFSVAISDDGNILAINQSSTIRLFERSVNTFNQLYQTGTGFTYFGTTATKSLLSLSSNGDYLISAMDTDQYIFKRSGAVWNLVKTITDPIDTAANPPSVCISSDGLVAAVGSQFEDVGGANSGEVYIYNNVADVWSAPQIFNGASGDQIGSGVTCGSGNKVVAVGRSGANRVYNNSSGTWSLFQTYTGNLSSLGHGVSGSKNELFLISGNINLTSNTGFSYASKSDGTIFSQLANLVRPSPATNQYYGNSSGLNSDGTIAVVGAYGIGQVFVFY